MADWEPMNITDIFVDNYELVNSSAIWYQKRYNALSPYTFF